MTTTKACCTIWTTSGVANHEYEPHTQRINIVGIDGSIMVGRDCSATQADAYRWRSAAQKPKKIMPTPSALRFTELITQKNVAQKEVLYDMGRKVRNFAQKGGAIC